MVSSAKAIMQRDNGHESRRAVWGRMSWSDGPRHSSDRIRRLELTALMVVHDSHHMPSGRTALAPSAEEERRRIAVGDLVAGRASESSASTRDSRGS